MQDLFADLMINLTIHQGIARLDFARMESIDPAKKQASFNPSLRLALPLEAFMQMADQVARVRETILKQGKPEAAPPAANREQ